MCKVTAPITQPLHGCLLARAHTVAHGSCHVDACMHTCMATQAYPHHTWYPVTLPPIILKQPPPFDTMPVTHHLLNLSVLGHFDVHHFLFMLQLSTLHILRLIVPFSAVNPKTVIVCCLASLRCSCSTHDKTRFTCQPARQQHNASDWVCLCLPQDAYLLTHLAYSLNCGGVFADWAVRHSSGC